MNSTIIEDDDDSTTLNTFALNEKLNEPLLLLTSSNDEQDDTRNDTTRPLDQGNKYQDVPFALAFLFHLALILILSFAYGYPAVDDQQHGVDLRGILHGLMHVFTVSFISGLVCVSIVSVIVVKFAASLIKLSFWTSIAIWFGVSVLCLARGLLFAAFLSVIVGGIHFCYYWAVKGRIPCAQENIQTAAEALTSNSPMVLVGLFFMFLKILWCYVWMYAMIGLFQRHAESNNCDLKSDDCRPNEAAQILLVGSFFWTQLVLANSVHVTVAGVVGTWWFSPAECGSKAVKDSFIRALTSSFGSICFGSLILAFVQTLRAIANEARNRDNDDRGSNILLCCAECLLSCVEDLLEYFNRWAFVYCGIYGYNYFTAGKMTFELFREKGWDIIITDTLIQNVLLAANAVVAVLTGIITIFFVHDVEEFSPNSSFYSFVMGITIGYLLSATVTGLISSAVNTVLVCFAEAPREFQINHSERSAKMLGAWQKAYPGVEIMAI